MSRPYGRVADGVARPDGVVARGEFTGHAHRLEGGVVYAQGDRVYVAVGPEARVAHEEHATLELPEGLYLVVRQREYRGEDEWVNVRD